MIFAIFVTAALQRSNSRVETRTKLVHAYAIPMSGTERFV
jgi:hypothetical protein